MIGASRSRGLTTALAIGTVVVATMISASEARSESVCGQLLDRNNVPLRGAAVWLVHPRYRNIGPVYSNPIGYFCFTRVEPDQTPYFMRIFWGSRLIYQKPIRIMTSVNLAPIKF